MNVRDGGAVLVHHELAVLHAEHLPVCPHQPGQVPQDQQAVLAAHYDLTLVNCRTQDLQLNAVKFSVAKQL